MYDVDAEISYMSGEPGPKPEPESCGFVKAEVVAAWLGISATKTHELARAGVIIRKRAGRGDVYDLRECVLAYIGHVQHLPKTEAARLQLARRVKLEIETERLRGELVPAVDVERQWSTILTEFRGQMLSVPSRVGERLPQLILADIEVIDRAIRDALTEASAHGDD